MMSVIFVCDRACLVGGVEWLVDWLACLLGRDFILGSRLSENGCFWEGKRLTSDHYRFSLNYPGYSISPHFPSFQIPAPAPQLVYNVARTPYSPPWEHVKTSQPKLK